MPGPAVTENYVLRLHPITNLDTVGAKLLYSFSERRLGVLERVLLTIEIRFVLIRFFSMSKCLDLRRCSHPRHFSPRLIPLLDPLLVVKLPTVIQSVRPQTL